MNMIWLFLVRPYVENLAVGDIAAKAQLNPVAGVHVAVRRAGGARLVQSGYTPGVALDGDTGEVVDVKHAEHMAADIEHKN